MRNTKIFLYLLILFIIFNAELSADETAETAEAVENTAPFRIGTGAGYSFAGYREETDLPLNRYVNSFVFIIDGNIEKDKFIYSFNTSFLFGKTNAIEINANENYFTYYQKESNFIRASLENALDYRLWGNNKFPGYLGGALRCDVYFINLPETFYYNLTAAISLNAHITQKWHINEKNTLIFSASFPIFGYAVRPPYYGLLYSPMDLEKDFISLHNYWALFCDVKYQYKINSLLCFYSNLGIELSHINFPQPRKDALIRLSAGVSFIF
ncbi:MAG: hypothetical protein FWB77_05690 [Treponema sp.]|nr:hypothetical protein [Treponema sp.]